jgi:hypothetical protein
MKRVILGICGALIVACMFVSVTVHAVAPWCPECYLVTLPWEHSPQGVCLDFLGWGWEWCLDGWEPGDYCILSNDFCDNLTYESPTF